MNFFPPVSKEITDSLKKDSKRFLNRIIMKISEIIEGCEAPSNGYGNFLISSFLVTHCISSK